MEPSLCPQRAHPAMKAQPRVHHRSCLQAALPTPAPFFPFSKICNTKDLLPPFMLFAHPKGGPRPLFAAHHRGLWGSSTGQHTAGHSRMRHRPLPTRYPETWSQVWTKARLLLHTCVVLQGMTTAELPAACPPWKATELGLCQWAGSAPHWST